MRLLLDENLSLITLEHARRIGHDARRLSSAEIGRRLRDEEVASIAASENRFLLTFAVEFGERFVSCQFRTLGMLVLRVRDQRPETINPLLGKFFSKFPDEKSVNNKLFVLAERKIRVRDKH